MIFLFVFFFCQLSGTPAVRLFVRDKLITVRNTNVDFIVHADSHVNEYHVELSFSESFGTVMP